MERSKTEGEMMEFEDSLMTAIENESIKRKNQNMTEYDRMISIRKVEAFKNYREKKNEEFQKIDPKLKGLKIRQNHELLSVSNDKPVDFGNEVDLGQGSHYSGHNAGYMTNPTFGIWSD